MPWSPVPVFRLLLATLLLAPGAGFGASTHTHTARTFGGTVQASVEKVIDGDTLKVRAFVWLGQSVVVLVRIAAIDAPELKGACTRERTQAKAARDFLVHRLGHTDVHLTGIAYDKYGGRVRARVSDSQGDIGEALLQAGLARRYDGGRRGSWCPTA